MLTCGVWGPAVEHTGEGHADEEGHARHTYVVLDAFKENKPAATLVRSRNELGDSAEEIP